MTRPLGAALGDLLASPKETIPKPDPSDTTDDYYPQQGGGAGMDYGCISVLFIGVIFILVGYLTYTGADLIAITTENVEAAINDEISKNAKIQDNKDIEE